MSRASVRRAKWQSGGTAFGAWAAIPRGFAAELLCSDGVDYQQRGSVGYDAMIKTSAGASRLRCYSTDIPAARSGAPFFSISGPMMLSKYSVERCSGGTT